MNTDLGKKIDPRALSVAELARLLTVAGGRDVSVESIETDLVDGAPANPDGSINLVHYTAWLAKHVK